MLYLKLMCANISLSIKYRNSAFQHLLKIIERQSGKIDLLIERLGMVDTRMSIPTADASDSDLASINLPMTQEAGDKGITFPTMMFSPEPAPRPPFHGPASSTFLIGLAHLWLDQGLKAVQNAEIEAAIADYGILSMLDNGEDKGAEDDQNDMLSSQRDRGRNLFSLGFLKELTLSEAITLIRQYDDMIGVRYPFLEIDVLIQQTKELYLLLGMSPSERDETANSLAINMDIASIYILKMLLAVVLACEGGLRSALGRRFFDSMQSTVQEKLLGSVTITKDLALLILVVREN